MLQPRRPDVPLPRSCHPVRFLRIDAIPWPALIFAALYMAGTQEEEPASAEVTKGE